MGVISVYAFIIILGIENQNVSLTIRFSVSGTLNSKKPKVREIKSVNLNNSFVALLYYIVELGLEKFSTMDD